VIDLGRLRYRDALSEQRRRLEEVLEQRERTPEAERDAGIVLMVEHDPPVITLTPRAGVNLLASPGALAQAGIEVEETDRGGDITYHGPGQLVVYPILDLNLLRLRLHEYMRLLESTVIDTCASFGLATRRDACAAGVWAPQARIQNPAAPDGACALSTDAKICAMGVRIRRWVSMHGLALNVTTDLSHFAHIVPCGLAGRPVTSLERELGASCPAMGDVKARLAGTLLAHLEERASRPEPSAAAATP
jgi:lipoyl(octanoyl) transferase